MIGPLNVGHKWDSVDAEPDQPVLLWVEDVMRRQLFRGDSGTAGYIAGV